MAKTQSETIQLVTKLDIPPWQIEQVKGAALLESPNALSDPLPAPLQIVEVLQ
jgi:hypothetical protein